MSNGDEDNPISRREGNLIWEKMKDLDGSVETLRKETRENFQIVFGKLDGIQPPCEAHALRMDAIEGRVDRLNGQFRNERSERQSLWSRALKNAQLFLSVAAILIAGAVALAKVF